MKVKDALKQIVNSAKDGDISTCKTLLTKILNAKKDKKIQDKSVEVMKELFKEETTIQNKVTVFESLKIIAENKQHKRITFNTGEVMDVDSFTAECMMRLHSKLLPELQEKFIKGVNESSDSFMKILNLALKVK